MAPDLYCFKYLFVSIISSVRRLLVFVINLFVELNILAFCIYRRNSEEAVSRKWHLKLSTDNIFNDKYVVCVFK
jgi:hypothetical protein